MRTTYLLAVAATALTAAIAVAAPGEGRLAKLDANGDGSITRAEFDTRAAERFGRIDVDRDGAVTAAEITTHRDAMMARHAEKRGDRAAHGGRGRHHEGRGDGLARRDANGDGRLSLAEFQAGHAKRFARMDADGDGRVTREEIAQLREARRAKRQG